jgi:hypothetical protein
MIQLCHFTAIFQLPIYIQLYLYSESSSVPLLWTRRTYTLETNDSRMPAVKPKGFIPPDKKTARNSAPPRNDERLDVKLDTSKLEPTKNPNFFVPPQPHDKKAGRASATIRNADRLDARLEALKLEPTRNHEAEDKLRLEALGQHAPGRNRVVKLPIWPPKLSEKRIEFLVRKATTWALANSFVLIPPTPVDPNEDPDRPAPVPPPTRAQPAPLSLFPTPFPRRLYQQANSLQNMLNSLYMRVSLDHKFLDKVIGGSVIQVDEFQHLLWFFWRKSRNDAYAVCLVQQSIVLVLMSGSSTWDLQI